MIELGIGVDQLKERLGGERLGRIIRKVRDLTPVMRRIGRYILSIHRDRFKKSRGKEKTGVQFGSIEWVPLKAATIFGKRRAGFPNHLMVRSRALMDSMTLIGARDNVFRASREMVEVGSRNHVLGYKWQMKKRPMIFLTTDDREGIFEAMVEETRAFWTGSTDRLRAAYARRKAAESAAEVKA